MANQMIALQARAPQAPSLGAAAAQYGNMMANVANMEKMRTDREVTAAIRNVMSAPDFDPNNPDSLNKLIQLGPVGTDAAQKVMAAQRSGIDIAGMKQDQAIKRVETVGAGLIGLLRDPSDNNLAQTAQTFASVGMDPKEYQGVLKQVSGIADPNGRKQFVLEFIAQTPNAQAALKYVMPDVKSEKIGDAQVFTDNNPNSPTFGAELFRITASPEPVKLNQQVVDNTLYNVNPITGVAQEAIIGDATQGLVQGPRTYTRTDTGVRSPYSIAAPRVGTETTAEFAQPTSLPGAPAAPARGAPSRGGGGGRPVAAALQTNPGALKDGPFARSQPGYTGARGGFATFNTPEAGIRAQENLLRTSYVGKGFNTIDKIVNRYAPPGRENSVASVENYKSYIAQRTGLDVNAPISAAQIPAVAAAMREFETGNRPGGQPSGAPKTVAEAATEKAFKKILPIIGYDPATGKDRVSDLIAASTSGGAEMLGSEIVGAVSGKATPGRVALGELNAIAENMTFEKLRGKLGAQISDADVRLIARTMADIANGNIPANQRAAAWKNVVLPLLLRGANVEAPKSPPPGASTRPKPTPADIQAVRRNRNSREWTEGFRRQFGDAALRSALGGR